MQHALYTVSMDTLINANIFFFISSVGFIVLGVLAIVALVHIIHILEAFARISKKIENDVNSIGDTTKEMIEEMKDSMVYRFLFGASKKKTKKKRATRK